MSSSMPIVSAPIPAGNRKGAVAPWWHTVLVLAALAGLSTAGAFQHGFPNVHIPGINARLSSYFTILAAEWLLIFLIWLGLRSRGLSIASLVSGRWPSVGSFFKDLGLGIGFIVVIVAIEAGLGYLLHADPDSTLGPITPKTLFELAVWLALSATAGFCEEFTFRGYLTRQFAAWTDSDIAAIVLQGALFGLCHAYYGYKMVFVIAIHGCLLGALSYWRKSLRPAMLAHGLQDMLGGVAAFLGK
jgi:uncharacterized protein